MKSISYEKAPELLIRNGILLDPASGEERRADVLISDGRIARIAENIEQKNIPVFDARGRYISPGWFDMHVHFREPGREDKETIATGCAAAVSGGFTGVCPMPNTAPVADNRGIIEMQIAKAEETPVDLHPIAAATVGQRGEELSEMADLVDAGAVAFSDDGVAIATAAITRRAMEYASMYDVPIIEHCEDISLARGGAMNEGAASTRLGLPGIPGIAEDLIVARDILLAEYTGARVHIAHISTAGAVELVRRAKKRGVKVTCEVTPHHFCLTDDHIESYDANYKMNPPLRTQNDVEAMIAGLKDGTIDVIATDHAPHAPEEKEVEFTAAPFGITGLETAIGLIISKLVLPGHLSLVQALEKITRAPRHILNLPQAIVQEGEPANLTLFDAAQKWQVRAEEFYSKSRNSPFIGEELTGRAVAVYNRGLFWQRPAVEA